MINISDKSILSFLFEIDINFNIKILGTCWLEKNIYLFDSEKGDEYAAEVDYCLFYFSFLYDGHVNNILIFET